MVYEEGFILPLILTGIPITVFKDAPQQQNIIEQSPIYKNVQYVHQNKWGVRFFGVFHTKLMLLEFDDQRDASGDLGQQVCQGRDAVVRAGEPGSPDFGERRFRRRRPEESHRRHVQELLAEQHPQLLVC